MDLNKLKQNYKKKQKPYVITIVFFSVLLAVSFLLLPISIIVFPDDGVLESFIELLFYAPIFLVFGFFGSLILFVIKKEKHRLEIIEDIYSKLLSKSSNEDRHTYVVKSVSDLPKNYFRGIGLYRFHIMKCSLFLMHSQTRNELYHVKFEQRRGNRSHIFSSGILYSYTISFHSRPAQIIELLHAKGIKVPLKHVEFKGRNYLYCEINQQIPNFKHFSEEEKQIFFDYYKIFLWYFDTLSDVLE